MRPLTLVLVFALSACSQAKPEPQPSPSGATADAKLQFTSKSAEAIEQVKKGEALLVNQRAAEAASEFAQALTLDPDFVLARALHGQAISGPEGLKELEAAVSAGSGVTEAERAMMQGLLALRQGEPGKAREAYTRLTQLAPGDWRGYFLLGNMLILSEDYAGGIPSLRKAVELDPAAGGANNMLGYAALQQEDTEGAIKAFNDYARALPQEPNPQDSLGEALLAAGRFDEAEAAYRKALELSPEFFGAWEGIAYAKYFAGDSAAALDALMKEKAAATRPNDKLAADELRAVMMVAQNNTAAGLSLYSDLEKMKDAIPGVAFMPVHRAAILIDLGRSREAMPLIAAALKRADSGELPPGPAANLRRQALRARVAAEVSMNNADAAAQTAMLLEQRANERKDDVVGQSAMHYGLGMASMAKRDFTGARAHFEQCLKRDPDCRRQIVAAAQEANDKPAAEAARAAVLKLYVRDPVHLWVRSRLQSKPATSSSE
jgi:tetratricopeptide (TPR) repeat protein